MIWRWTTSCNLLTAGDKVPTAYMNRNSHTVTFLFRKLSWHCYVRMLGVRRPKKTRKNPWKKTKIVPFYDIGISGQSTYFYSTLISMYDNNWRSHLLCNYSLLLILSPSQCRGYKYRPAIYTRVKRTRQRSLKVIKFWTLYYSITLTFQVMV